MIGFPVNRSDTTLLFKAPPKPQNTHRRKEEREIPSCLFPLSLFLSHTPNGFSRSKPLKGRGEGEAGHLSKKEKQNIRLYQETREDQLWC